MSPARDSVVVGCSNVLKLPTGLVAPLAKDATQSPNEGQPLLNTT